MHEIYVREAIEKGLDESRTGRTKDVSEIMKKYGLPMKIHWTETAEAHLDAIYAHIAQDSKTYALRPWIESQRDQSKSACFPCQVATHQNMMSIKALLPCSVMQTAIGRLSMFV